MTQSEALQLADELEKKWFRWKDNPTIELKAAAELRRLHEENEEIRQALVQEQEPVAWISTNCIGESYLCFSKPTFNDEIQPLYTALPKREWVGLTDDEIGWLWHNSPPNSHEYARAIEAKLKEKNT